MFLKFRSFLIRQGKASNLLSHASRGWGLVTVKAENVSSSGQEEKIRRSSPTPTKNKDFGKGFNLMMRTFSENLLHVGSEEI